MGSQDSVEAKMGVVNRMLAAVRGACEACVKEERDTRDRYLADINEAKVNLTRARLWQPDQETCYTIGS